MPVVIGIVKHRTVGAESGAEDNYRNSRADHKLYVDGFGSIDATHSHLSGFWDINELSSFASAVSSKENEEDRVVCIGAGAGPGQKPERRWVCCLAGHAGR